ncbi:type II secretion system F family protein [Rhodococcus hoagii]|nr:type II secretion system F family protein [Prescottella equi]NKT07085.1 type II secretion system F family protein [Prescottella equi]
MIPPLVLMAALSVGGALGVLVWLTAGARDPERGPALQNLQSQLALPIPESGGAPPLSLGRFVKLLSPPGTMARLERLHILAGRPAAWVPERAAMAKIVLAAAAALLGLLAVGSSPGVGRVLFAAAAVALAYFVPELLLQSRGQERQAAIELALADTLDQMTIAVEAGLGFEAAMQRAAKNGKGPLAEEFIRTLQDIQMGQSRRIAYLDLAARTKAPNLRRFLRAVIQADEYGVAIAEVLRTQASEMRLKRRQSAEEKAMKVPVKVLFPLMTCILPTIFIVILGPAVINMMEVLGGT